VARPRTALLAGVLVTTLGASGLPRLALRTDGKTIHPSGERVGAFGAAGGQERSLADVAFMSGCWRG